MFNFIFDGKIGEILAPVVPSNQLFLAIQHHKDIDELNRLIKLRRNELHHLSEVGYAAIHVACRYNNRLALELILSNGIQIDLLDSQGNTPLHYASKYGNIELCKYLVENGSNVGKLNNRKQSAYDVAESHNVRQYLLPIIFQAERQQPTPETNLYSTSIHQPLMQSPSMNPSHTFNPPPVLPTQQNPVINNPPSSNAVPAKDGVVPTVYSAYSNPASSTNRAIIPDGFHSSHSDPKLQASYGHLIEAPNVAPPPTNIPVTNFAPPQQMNSYSLYGNQPSFGAPPPSTSIYNRYVSYDPHTNKAVPPPQTVPPPLMAMNNSYVNNFQPVAPPSIQRSALAPPQSVPSSAGSVPLNPHVMHPTSSNSKHHPSSSNTVQNTSPQNKLLGNLQVPNIMDNFNDVTKQPVAPPPMDWSPSVNNNLLPSQREKISPVNRKLMGRSQDQIEGDGEFTTISLGSSMKSKSEGIAHQTINNNVDIFNPAENFEIINANSSSSSVL